MKKIDTFDMKDVNVAIVNAIKAFLSENGETESSFAKCTGLNQMTAYRQMKGLSPVSLESLLRLKANFPQFSIDNALEGNSNTVNSNNSVGSDNVFNHANVQVSGVPSEKFVEEITEQRKLLATAQAQITSLLGIIEKMQEK